MHQKRAPEKNNHKEIIYILNPLIKCLILLLTSYRKTQKKPIKINQVNKNASYVKVKKKSILKIKDWGEVKITDCIIIF